MTAEPSSINMRDDLKLMREYILGYLSQANVRDLIQPIASESTQSYRAFLVSADYLDSLVIGLNAEKLGTLDVDALGAIIEYKMADAMCIIFILNAGWDVRIEIPQWYLDAWEYTPQAHRWHALLRALAVAASELHEEITKLRKRYD